MAVTTDAVVPDAAPVAGACSSPIADAGVQGTIKTAAKNLAPTAVPPPGYLNHLKVSISRKDDPTAKVSESL